jgi:hypothetical protein
MAAVKGRQGQALGTIEDMQALARRHNGRCLSSGCDPAAHGACDLQVSIGVESRRTGGAIQLAQEST